MTVLLILSLTLLGSQDRVPLRNLFQQAVSLVEGGRHHEASVLLEEIHRRMPHQYLAAYNFAANLTSVGSFSPADSLLSLPEMEEIEEEALLEAASSARLGMGMQSEDYGAVSSVVEMLLPRVSSATATDAMLQNWEVALKWLEQNEPPPEDEQEPDDQEDEQEPDDQEDEQEPDDQEDEQEPDDQEDEQEPDDQEDEQEPDDQEDEQEEPDDSPEDHQPPPEQPEMTPEVAQMILDMVEEAEEESQPMTPAGVPGAPVW